MDESLLAAYQATDYRVRLARGGCAVIRIGQRLPASLASLAQDRPWGFITAWNPRSQVVSIAQNRAAQRQLLGALRTLAGTALIRPAVGAAVTGAWREPSLWVVGPDIERLDPLAIRFGQFGYVHGQRDGVAMLRLTRLT